MFATASRRERNILTVALQPAPRNWYRYSKTTHSPAHQPRILATERHYRRSKDNRPGEQFRRVGRVPAHSWPEVPRLQQDTGRDCKGDGVQNWSKCWYLACTHQLENILAKCPHAHAGRLARSNKGACWRSAKGYRTSDPRDGSQADQQAQCHHSRCHRCEHRFGQL